MPTAAQTKFDPSPCTNDIAWSAGLSYSFSSQIYLHHVIVEIRYTKHLGQLGT